MNASLPPSPLNDTQRQQIDALVRELNPQQLDWMQGYLAGYRAALQPGAAPVAPSTPDSPVLTVLYGSQTGNCETLAERLTEQARARGLNVECLSMDEFPNRLLKQTRQIAVIVSTHGEGDPPDTDRKSTRLNSSHVAISYAVFCLKKKKPRPQTHLPISSLRPRDRVMQ